jgi:hypothetical protein
MRGRGHIQYKRRPDLTRRGSQPAQTSSDFKTQVSPPSKTVLTSSLEAAIKLRLKQKIRGAKSPQENSAKVCRGRAHQAITRQAAPHR